MNREKVLYLEKVINNTLEILREGGYQLDGSTEWVDLEPSLKRLRIGSEIYLNIIPSFSSDTNPGYPTKITVEDKDTFEKAREWGKEAAVLNMASDIVPGGGVLKGSMAQEEELARRSTLLGSLYMYWGKKGKSYLGKESFGNYYPLRPLGAIWSPEVAVIKDRRYNLLATPFLVNVISMAAIRKPKLMDNGEMIPSLSELMERKILALLRIAVGKGVRKLVLGAWGCGAFHCPPHQVANLFLRVITGKEMMGRFEEICFAILDNPKKKENNYEIFKSIICQ